MTLFAFFAFFACFADPSDSALTPSRAQAKCSRRNNGLVILFPENALL